MDADDISRRLAAQFEKLDERIPGSPKYKRTGRRPYYNEEFGMAAKELVDTLLADPSIPQRIPVQGTSPSTERQKIYQGLDYLLDHLDPEEKYKRTRPYIRTNLGDDYVLVRLAKVEFAGFRLKPVAVDYMDEVTEFINSATVGQKYAPENVILSDNQVLLIRAALAEFGDMFLSIVQRNKLYIIREKP